jgi:hypothetical protein
MAEWDPALIRGLATRRRLIMFDNRGNGDSTGSVKHFSVHVMAGDAAGVIDGLKLGRVDVLGWSMGGFIAQELTLDTWLTAIASQPGVTSRDFTVSPATKAAQKTATHSLWLGRGEGTYARLSAIRARTLVAYGAKDVVVPSSNAQLLLRRIPHAVSSRVRDAGHAFLFSGSRQRRQGIHRVSRVSRRTRGDQITAASDARSPGSQVVRTPLACAIRVGSRRLEQGVLEQRDSGREPGREGVAREVARARSGHDLGRANGQQLRCDRPANDVSHVGQVVHRADHVGHVSARAQQSCHSDRVRGREVAGRPHGLKEGAGIM